MVRSVRGQFLYYIKEIENAHINLKQRFIGVWENLRNLYHAKPCIPYNFYLYTKSVKAIACGVVLQHTPLNGDAPCYLKNLLHYKRQVTRSGHRLKYFWPSQVLPYGDRAFEVAAPKLWNTLPLGLSL